MRPSPALVLALAAFASITYAKEKPNIVLIMVDDMGWSDIGPYGAEIIQTPNLDKLAANGLRFRQFYNNAKCTTTRATLLTGLYPRQGGRGIELLNDQMVTLGEAMNLAGYQTGISGKWHNGSRKPHRPFDRGFEQSYGLWDGACNFFDPTIQDPQFKGSRKRVFGQNDKLITEFPKDYYLTDAFTDNAIRMIYEFSTNEAPYLLYVPYTAPHYPLHAKPKDIAKYKGKFSKGWDDLQERRHQKTLELGLVSPEWKLPPRDPEAQSWNNAKNKDWQNLRMEVYAAMIDNVDQNIGRIISAVEKSGEANNTLILFLSDNGSCAESPGGENNVAHIPGPKEYYSHVGPSWAYAQNAPFRRYKSRMHEGGIATPLIAYWPKVIPKNSFTNQIGHIIDFLPTFLEMGEGSYPTKYRGKSILPAEGISLLSVFKSPSETITRRKPLYWFFSGNRAIREGDWKLVWDQKVKKWELYNLTNDRTEMYDLAGKKPTLVKQLRIRWEKWAHKTDVNYKN